MECIAEIKMCESKEDKVKSFALQCADMSQCKQSRGISEDKESTNNCCDITKPYRVQNKIRAFSLNLTAFLLKADF